jgi:hypothetical protein
MGSVPFQQVTNDMYQGPASARSSEAAQSVPSGAGQGIDSASLMGQIERSNQQIQQLSKQAVTPIAMKSAGQLPDSMTRQIGPAPQTPNQGRPQNKGQAMGDMIRSAGNAISKVITAEKEHKQEQMVSVGTKFLTAQNAKNEAQQALDVAMKNNDGPAIAAAKDALSKNETVLQSITSDKKNRDLLVKGFNFNHIDPSENKTEEHDAMKKAAALVQGNAEKKAAMLKAQQDYKAGLNQQGAKAFQATYEKSQPTVMEQDTRAQAQLQVALAQQKPLMEAQKNFMNFQAAADRTNMMGNTAQMRAMAGVIHQQAVFDHQQNMLNQHFEQAQKLLGERFGQSQKLLGEKFGQELKLVSVRGAEAVKTAGEIYANKEADPLTIHTKNRAALQKYDSNAIVDGGLVNTWLAARAKAYKDASGKPDLQQIQAIDQHVQNLNQQLKLDQSSAQNLRKADKQLTDMFNIQGGSDGGSTNGAGSIESDSTGSSSDEETDYTDPTSY